MLPLIGFYGILLCAFLVQALTGFGGPLISMPLGISLVGVEVAKPLATFCSFLTSGLVTLRAWRSVSLRQLGKMTAVMLLGLFAGLLVFHTVEMDFLLLAYGIIVVAIGLRHLLLPRAKPLTGPLSLLFLVAAGLMQGLFVSGGSFLVVYALGVLPEKQTFRATVSALWTVINAVMLLTYLVDGTLTLAMGKLFLPALLPVALAVLLGSHFSQRIHQKTFTKLIYGVLVLSGVILLLTH